MTEIEREDLPRLKCDPFMRTVEGWKHDLVKEGHVCFSLDGERYFIYTNAPHTYVLNTLLANQRNLGGDKVFHSEDELLDAKIFRGRSIRERLGEILVCDQA